jgi:type VI secretion system protein ImpA
MPDLDLSSLLSPLAGDAPCGPDLVYDPEFGALQRLMRVRAEQQFGDTVIPAEEPDWVAVHEQALALAQRTRDLRVAILLMRSRARLQGVAAANQGLQLVQGLLERHWEHLHPQLDASDGGDPTERMNALADLAAADAGLADWRAARLTEQRDSLTVRQIELAAGKVSARPGEFVPTPDGVNQALQDARTRWPDIDQRLGAGLAALKAIETLLADRVDSALRPDLKPLRLTLQALAQWATASAADTAGAAALDTGAALAAPATAGARPAGSGVPGAIHTRADAIQALERVCDWIEQHEPSHPAPLLIRRAQRLMSKNFLEIVRDLVPEGLDQVQRLAGLESS